MTVRPAAPRDAAAIAALVHELGTTTTLEHTARALAELAIRPDHAVWVGGTGDRVEGWIHVHVVHRVGGEPFGEVSGLVVQDTMRRKGLGTALMEAAETWARARGLHTIRVRTNETRSDARRFYGERAYRPIKTQVVFQKALLAGDDS